MMTGLNVEIANIAVMNDGDDFLESTKPILLSIVNIEEDRTLRNQSLYTSKKDVNGIDLGNQKVFVGNQEKHLVASLLFSVYQKNSLNNTYLEGIDNLQMIITRLQKNQILYVNKTDSTDIITFELLSLKSDADKKKYQQISFEFVSLSYDQLNQLWSSLGSRYMPSVLYKLKFISIQAFTPQDADNLIEKVDLQLWENNPQNHTGLIEESKNI